MAKRIILNFLIILILITVAGLNLVSAQQITGLNINKKNFVSGDEILLKVSFINPEERAVNLRYVIGPESGDGQRIARSINLNGSKQDHIFYESKVNDLFENGKYNVLVELTDEMQNQIFDRRSISFNVEGIENSIFMSPMEFDVNICGDSRCRSRSKVYPKNERIYFSYTSEEKGLEVDATIVYPDKSRRKIYIPSDMKFEKVGNYQIEVNAKKDGLREVTRTESFGILEGNAEISSYVVHESPLSSLGGDIIDETGSKIYVYLIMLILVSGVAIVGIILYIVVKK